MAHKTLIDGTAYEISGGKTLVDGTAYSIKEGKTLIDGTEHEIGFSKTLTITGNGGYKAFVATDNATYYEGEVTIPFTGSMEIYCRAYGVSGRAGAIFLNGEVVKMNTNYAEYNYTATGNVKIKLSYSTYNNTNVGDVYITEL